jgi:hypothetical protein
VPAADRQLNLVPFLPDELGLQSQPEHKEMVSLGRSGTLAQPYANLTSDATSDALLPRIIAVSCWQPCCLASDAIAENASPAQHRISCATQLAFPRSAPMLLADAFDPIPVLAAIVRKLFGDPIQSAWRGPTLASIAIELH